MALIGTRTANVALNAPNTIALVCSLEQTLLQDTRFRLTVQSTEFQSQGFAATFDTTANIIAPARATSIPITINCIPTSYISYRTVVVIEQLVRGSWVRLTNSATGGSTFNIDVLCTNAASAPDPATGYYLTSSTNLAPAGTNFTVTLHAGGATDGTQVRYTVSNVNSSDVNGVPLAGNFNVVGGIGYVTFQSTPSASAGLVVSLPDYPGVVVTVTLTVESSAPFLTVSPAQVSSGSGFDVTLHASSLADGSVVPYEITGANTTDISNALLTGSFTVQSGTATAHFTSSVSTASRTFTISLVNYANATTSTTLTAAVPTYAVSSPSVDVEAGGSFIVVLNTANVNDGTTVAYNISGVSPSEINGAALAGVFTVTGGVATTAFQSTTSLTAKNFTLTVAGTSQAVTVFLKGKTGQTTYSTTQSTQSVDSGLSVAITLKSKDLTEVSSQSYQILGISSTETSTALQGTVAMTAGVATLTVANTSTVGIPQIATISFTDAGIQTTVELKPNPSVSYAATNNYAVIDFTGRVSAGGANPVFEGTDFSQLFVATVTSTESSSTTTPAHTVGVTNADVHPSVTSTGTTSGSSSTTITPQYTVSGTGSHVIPAVTSTSLVTGTQSTTIGTSLPTISVDFTMGVSVNGGSTVTPVTTVLSATTTFSSLITAINSALSAQGIVSSIEYGNIVLSANSANTVEIKYLDFKRNGSSFAPAAYKGYDVGRHPERMVLQELLGVAQSEATRKGLSALATQLTGLRDRAKYMAGGMESMQSYSAVINAVLSYTKA